MNCYRLIHRCFLAVASGVWLLTGCFASSSSSDPLQTQSDGGSTHASTASSGTTSGSSTHSSASASSSASAAPSSGGNLGPYTTSGNEILDKNGNEHFFRGLDRPSLESSCTGNINAPYEYSVMASWGANVVRLPLNQDCWINSSSNPAYNPSYESTVDQQVQGALAYGMDIILDLHWSDTGNFSVGNTCLTSNGNCAQVMADSNSNTFWQQVATKYKNVANVIFELYNEPHVGSTTPSASDWGVWLNGGASGTGFTVVGMQTLYNTVRSTGANNLIIVGGQNWAFDLSQVPSYAITPMSGQPLNVIYNTHPYSNKNSGDSAWESAFGFLTQTYPVIATEFGDIASGQPMSSAGSATDCDPSFDTSLIQFMGQQSNPAPSHKMSWTAWAFDPDVPLSQECTFPDLIYDTQFDPNAVGTVVEDALTAGP
ncbi:MAG TPA: cellulase family glycosylhydrolase [Polyangiaceae bacterium]|nr:cellulase family glycosylhydrolase [Polyangiaceae bacterium]